MAGKPAFINERLVCQERDLTQPRGVLDRPWFRHWIYTPGNPKFARAILG